MTFGTKLAHCLSRHKDAVRIKLIISGLSRLREKFYIHNDIWEVW